MNNNGCLALLLNKWRLSLHGSHTLGFPPPNILFLIHTALSSQASYTLLGCAVDLVKPKLAFMHLPLFTLQGAK